MAQTQWKCLSHRTVHGRVPGPWVALHRAVIQGSWLPGSHTIFTKELQPFSFLPWDAEGAIGRWPGFPLMHTSLLLTLCWQKHSDEASLAAREAGKHCYIPATVLLPLLWLCLVMLRSSAPGSLSTDHLTMLFQVAVNCPCQVRAAAFPLMPWVQLISGCNVQQTVTAEENYYAG